MNPEKRKTSFTDLNLARVIAIIAHFDQPYDDGSYICTHLDRVAEYVRPFGLKYQTLAYLHDILEDTFVNRRTLEKLFGEDIAHSVWMLTDEEGKNRKERKAKTYKKQVNCTDIEVVVKVADRLVNIESSINNQKKLKMYDNEHNEFKNIFYRPGLCDNFWIRIEDTLILSRCMEVD